MRQLNNIILEGTVMDKPAKVDGVVMFTLLSQGEYDGVLCSTIARIDATGELGDKILSDIPKGYEIRVCGRLAGFDSIPIIVVDHIEYKLSQQYKVLEVENE